jgi:SAM-dependent methyltransferase
VSAQGLWEREREFHDSLAARRRDGELPPLGPDRYDEQFEQAIVSALRPLGARRVLELGCGDGELTFRLVDLGAEVTALDISPGMVDLAERRLARHRPQAAARFVVGTAEDTGLESGAFDAVVGKWLLHHTDLAAAAAELDRLLRPGGTGIFIETSALNPLLGAARTKLPGRGGIARYGTPDEHPLGRRDLALLRSRFASCEVDFPNFILFHLLDRHVAQWRWRRFTRATVALDRAVERRLRPLGRLSYYMRVRVTK